MSVVACPKCYGRQVVSPLGFVEHKCSHCKGIGYVTVTAEQEPVKLDAVAITTHKRKRKLASDNMVNVINDIVQQSV